jgi:hypothetical protein
MNLPDDVTHGHAYFWIEDEPVPVDWDEHDDSEEDD